MPPLALPPGVALGAPVEPSYEQVLTPEALGLVADLTRRFLPRLKELLAARVDRQKRLDAGIGYDFLAETKHVRDGNWTVAPLPDALLDRRVEITGPVDRKMVINALNSGASTFMADFEDASCPTWDNQVSGQVNLKDAVRRTISFEAKGKSYALNERTATLLVRPRGFHLFEKHVTVDGERVPGSFFDFAVFFVNNAKEQIARGAGPFFYLPKLESHLEARLWNDVFLVAEEAIGIPRGTIKATVLIETLPAAFEMDEILFELKEHSSGLNCGRWDYIFSFIKKRRTDKNAVLPDRSQVTMDKGFLSAYAQLLIKTCHRREVHAMGGMAAQIPIKNDDAANEAAMAKVRADKLREATNGHDGTWVAHPALVPIAKAIFDEKMPGKNQIDKKRADVNVSREDLLAIPQGTRTEDGLRHNVRVGIQYMEAWLGGLGCVPLYNLMEDAATAEISRAQVWQWLHHKATLEGGQTMNVELLSRIVDEEMVRIASEVGAERFANPNFARAKKLFFELSTRDTFEDFLTLPAYEMITSTP